MKKKVKKFGRGGDILTGLGAGMLGYALYKKLKGEDDDEKKPAAVKSRYEGKSEQEKINLQAATKERGIDTNKKESEGFTQEAREDYLEKRGAKRQKETGTFAGTDTAPPNLDYRSQEKKAGAKKAAAAAAPKAAPATKKAEPEPPVKLPSQGSFKFDTKQTPADRAVTAEGKPKTLEDTSKKATKYGIGPYGAFSSIHKAISEYKTPAEARREERLKREKKDVASSGMRHGGSVKKYASGGSVSSASKRADGIAQRGKTRGRVL